MIEYFLDKFMREYLINTKEAGKTVLSYAITVEEPKVANPCTPSFPPTFLKYQTMCYKPTSGGTGFTGLDMFMFLEMTGENPKFPDWPLRTAGNWVIPGITATMATCKGELLGQVLGPAIEVFQWRSPGSSEPSEDLCREGGPIAQ